MTSVLLRRQLACVAGQPCFLDVKHFSCSCQMSHELPHWIISLHVFDEDMVANVTVSQGKSFVDVFVGPCPVFCCFAVLFCGETQIWLGDLRVAFGLGVFCLLIGVMLICHFHGPYVSLYKTAFHCLRNCKDRA